MNILNVDMTLNPLDGGTVQRTVQLSRHLAAAGMSVTVLATDRGLTDARRAELSGVRVEAVPCLNGRFYLPALGPARLRRLIREHDLVHLMGHWTVLNAMTYWGARAERKPFVFCPAGALPLLGRSLGLKRAYNLCVGRAIVRDAAALIATVPAEREDFALYGAVPERIVDLPNAADPAEYEAEPDAQLWPRLGFGPAPYVLFLGRLNWIKGPDLLIDAFQEIAGRIPSHHLVFAGVDEGMLAVVKARAAEAGILPRVHFVGHLTGQVKSRALHAASLLAVTSRSEVTSIVAIEAGMSGTPVLATHASRFAELEAVGGGRFSSGRPQEISEMLLSMLADPMQLEEMGDRLRTHCIMTYSWDAVIRKYIGVFSSLSRGNAR